jgi:hypothetical protein
VDFSALSDDHVSTPVARRHRRLPLIDLQLKSSVASLSNCHAIYLDQRDTQFFYKNLTVPTICTMYNKYRPVYYFRAGIPSSSSGKPDSVAATPLSKAELARAVSDNDYQDQLVAARERAAVREYASLLCSALGLGMYFHLPPWSFANAPQQVPPASRITPKPTP